MGAELFVDAWEPERERLAEAERRIDAVLAQAVTDEERKALEDFARELAELDGED
jgi:hypothetical protein